MATVNTYDIGDLVRLTGTLESVAGANVDPTTLVCKIKAPSGAVTTYTYGTDLFPVRSEAGMYFVDFTPTEAGNYWYRFASTGTGQAAAEQMFSVRPSPFE